MKVCDYWGIGLVPVAQDLLDRAMPSDVQPSRHENPPQNLEEQAAVRVRRLIEQHYRIVNTILIGHQRPSAVPAAAQQAGYLNC